MYVRDIMTTLPITVGPDMMVVDAAKRMLDYHISGLPVVKEDRKLIGIITEGDFMRRGELRTERHHGWLRDFLTSPGKLAEEYVQTHGRRIEEVMTTDVVSISPRATLSEAVELMGHHDLKQLPVVSAGKLVGIVTRADLVRTLVQVLPKATAAFADEKIQDAVRDQLSRQDWTGGGTIHCNIRAGIAELTGSIFDERERLAVRVLVENVEGVKSVIDRMVWIDPYSGIVIPPPDSPRPAQNGQAETQP